MTVQILVSLIDKAAHVCGGDRPNYAELARRLGCSRQFVGQMKARPETIPPEMAGLLADIAGEEIAPAVLAAVMESFTKTERGQRVREAMQKAFLGGAAATFSTFATKVAAENPSGMSRLSLTEYASYGLRRLTLALHSFPLSGLSRMSTFVCGKSSQAGSSQAAADRPQLSTPLRNLTPTGVA